MSLPSQVVRDICPRRRPLLAFPLVCLSMLLRVRVVGSYWSHICSHLFSVSLRSCLSSVLPFFDLALPLFGLVSLSVRLVFDCFAIQSEVKEAANANAILLRTVSRMLECVHSEQLSVSDLCDR